jgi:hypothetical protein
MTQIKIVEPGAKTCDEMRKELKRNYKKMKIFIII